MSKTDKADPEGFTFEHDGKTFALPPYQEALSKAPGGLFQEALLRPTRVNELRLVFAALEAAEANPAAIAALHAMPTEAMVATLERWPGE